MHVRAYIRHFDAAKTFVFMVWNSILRRKKFSETGPWAINIVIQTKQDPEKAKNTLNINRKQTELFSGRMQ